MRILSALLLAVLLAGCASSPCSCTSWEQFNKDWQTFDKNHS